jgi:hypothetical protein
VLLKVSPVLSTTCIYTPGNLTQLTTGLVKLDFVIDRSVLEKNVFANPTYLQKRKKLPDSKNNEITVITTTKKKD